LKSQADLKRRPLSLCRNGGERPA